MISVEPTFTLCTQFDPGKPHKRTYNLPMMRKQFIALLQWLILILAIPFILTGCFGSSGGPVSVLSSAVVTGSAPLDVGFDLSFSTHPQDKAMTFELEFGDASDSISGTEFSIIIHHTYEVGGTYEATLMVIDEDGNTDIDSLIITVDEAGPEIGIEVGNTAPDFEGNTTDGGHIKLSDYLGQVVVLDFWGSWCQPCQNSMPHLDDLVTKYADQGLVAIIVSTDVDEQDTINFLAANGLTQFVSVWKPGGKHDNPIDLLYDVTYYPTTFVLDRQGVIRWISIGFPGTLTEAILESLL